MEEVVKKKKKKKRNLTWAWSDLYVVHVDDRSGDVREQTDELLLAFTDQVGNLVENYFHSLVVSEDVNIHVGGRAVTRKIASQDLQLEVARTVGCEEVVCPDDAVS